MPKSRTFAARRNTEQSVKTVTNVPGPKCYQRARLQSLEPLVRGIRLLCLLLAVLDGPLRHQAIQLAA